MKTKITLLMLTVISIFSFTKVHAQFLGASPNWSAAFGDKFGFGVTGIPSFTIDVNGDINLTNGAYKFGGLNFLKLSNTNNVLLGIQAGFGMGSGNNNVFVGNDAGYGNTTGNLNSFIGFKAGEANVSGSYNSFFGHYSGYMNQSGSNNSYFGFHAYGDPAITNATAIGANAYAGSSNTLILGGTGSYAVNVGIGTSTPSYKLDVYGDINLAATTGASIFRYNGVQFIGSSTSHYSTFIGEDAGTSSWAANKVTFIGYHAGMGNSGIENTFLGANAGYSNSTGEDNTFIGMEVGYYNTNGNKNTFVGVKAGQNTITGSSNTFIGYNAGAASSGIFNSTAIGTNAVASSSGSIVLGTTSENIGVGVSSPLAKLDVNGSALFNNYSNYSGGTLATGTGSAAFVGINVLAPTNALEVNGNILCIGSGSTGNITAYSSLGGHLVYSNTELNVGTNINVSGNINMNSTTGDIIPTMTSSGTVPNNNLGQIGGATPSTTSPYNYIVGTIAPTSWFNSILCSDFLGVSDKRLKRDITDINYGLKDLMKLHSVSYYFKGKNDKQKRFGFIAQEIREIIPEVVYGKETDSNYLALNYIDLIPVLVSSIQEQQKTIDALQQQLNSIGAGNNSQKTSNPNSNSTTGTNSGSSFKNNGNSLGGDISVLYQNQPNPFKDNTTIEYYLTQNTQKASLLIFDMNGALLKTIQITQFGKGTVQINGGDLKPGMFFYSLIADNKEVDSKKMILLD